MTEGLGEFEKSPASGIVRERLAALTHLEVGPAFLAHFNGCPAPQKTAVNLERWLRASSNPATHLAELLDAPDLAKRILLILGASQPIADALIQNPELASLLSEPPSRHPDRRTIEAEGAALLSVADSPSYALDRLRYLRQRWILPIVAADLTGAWTQEHVWMALSELADALIALAAGSVWQTYSASKGLKEPCPVAILGFGKLGGHELNYSSDVDLVFIQEDLAQDFDDRHTQRFCEMLGRALSDKMGRGSLYRVDLRLRPFGGVGPVAPSRRSIEAYYRSHAQLWEAQALIRSRPITGSEELRDWWKELRQGQCFRSSWASTAIEEIVAMRRKIEEQAGDGDLKRGWGGIRDVEFLVQMMQMVAGHQKPDLQTANTLEAIGALLRAEMLNDQEAEILMEGYRFLRKSEHRCQLSEDQHTHDLPEDAAGQERLARLMGFDDWKGFSEELGQRRASVRAVYEARVRAYQAEDPKADVLRALGDAAPICRAWLESLPESDAFYRVLAENPDSLGILRKLAGDAPLIAEWAKRSVASTEMLLSGEVGDDVTPGEAIDRLSHDVPLERLAGVARAEWLRIAAQWVLNPVGVLGSEIALIADALMRHAMARLYAEFDVVALGSFASGDMCLTSDMDMVWLAETPDAQRQAETQAEQLLLMIDTLKRLGSPFGVDLRLRPEGRQGLLVRSYAGFKAYDLDEMEMWERFALGVARTVCGNPMAEATCLASAYALPLTPERLGELLAMKARIETERVSIKHRTRHVKLGKGGLSDIDWFVHLHELRYPTATQAGTRRETSERIRTLGHARLINALEQETLLEAREHLMATRDRIALLGFTTDVVPENPDRLEVLAAAAGFSDGNAFLSHHEDVAHTVRSIYEEGIDRLRN